MARTAFRDNSSFYTVNGRRTQFKAVARLLRAQGIDLDHNRFLILQVRKGKVMGADQEWCSVTDCRGDGEKRRVVNGGWSINFEVD